MAAYEHVSDKQVAEGTERLARLHVSHDAADTRLAIMNGFHRQPFIHPRAPRGNRLDGARRGMVVTTANRFSCVASAATNLCRQSDAVERLDLIDIQHFADVISSEPVVNAITPPWMNLLDHQRPGWQTTR